MSASSSRNTVRVNRAKMESPIFSPWGTEGKVEDSALPEEDLPGIISDHVSSPTQTGFGRANCRQMTPAFKPPTWTYSLNSTLVFLTPPFGCPTNISDLTCPILNSLTADSPHSLPHFINDNSIFLWLKPNPLSHFLLLSLSSHIQSIPNLIGTSHHYLRSYYKGLLASSAPC